MLIVNQARLVNLGGGGGTPPGPTYKIKVEYNDGTPDFEVPTDGTTIITKANGNDAINNHDHTKISKVTVADGMTDIADSCCPGNLNNKWQTFNGEFYMPNSITKIYNYAFYYWKAFNNVFTLSNNVTLLGSNVFKNWEHYNKSDIFIPVGINTVPGSTFSNWKSYQQSFTIQNHITHIGSYAFTDWNLYQQDFIFDHTDTIPTFDQTTGLIWANWQSHHPAKITTPNSTKTNVEWKIAIGDINYNGGDIESINGVAWNDISIEKIKIQYNDGTPDFIVPNDGTTIITQADGDTILNNHDETKIDTITVNDYITKIDNDAFGGTHDVRWQHVNINWIFPNSLTIFGAASFRGHKSQTQKFNFPSSLITIEGWVFYDWYLYNTIYEIPASVTSITNECFSFNKAYNQDFIFNHIDTIPDFSYSNTWIIWKDWKNYHPAKIVTPNSMNTNLEWKNALINNYNGGDIESINGILWDDINVAKVFGDGGDPFVETEWSIQSEHGPNHPTTWDPNFLEIDGTIDWVNFRYNNEQYNFKKSVQHVQVISGGLCSVPFNGTSNVQVQHLDGGHILTKYSAENINISDTPLPIGDHYIITSTRIGNTNNVEVNVKVYDSSDTMTSEHTKTIHGIDAITVNEHMLVGVTEGHNKYTRVEYYE